MKHKIAILNQKGGVGKTTTAVNLSAQIAADGFSVLLVDIDPQGNATSGLGLNKNAQSLTTYDVLIKQLTIDKAVQKTTVPNLFILPANGSLAASEIDLINQPRREHRLDTALEESPYDFVIIDCPPALGLLTINALTAANKLLIPVQAEYYALEGLGQLLEITQRIRQSLNPKLDILGVILTMYDKRTTLSENVLMEVKKHFGDKVFKTYIPRNVKLAEAPSYGKTIYQHDKWSKGSRTYKQLTKEVLSRLGERK